MHSVADIPRIKAFASVYWTVAVVGALYNIHLMFGTEGLGEYSLAYNYYFLSLTEGRLDVPAAVIGREGHYDQAGRAFMYYGILPALARAVFAPFTDIRSFWSAPYLILSCTLSAGFIAQRTVLTLFNRTRREGPRGIGDITLLAILAGAIWFASPIPMLSATPQLYHEPFAFSLICTVAFIHLALTTAKYTTRTLVMLALLAGLALLARPTMAVGLYAACAVLLLTVAIQTLLDFRAGRIAMPSVIARAGRILVPSAVLGAFGIGYILLFWATTGASVDLNGSTHTYGFLYFGCESPDSPRIQAFEEHGRFNLLRVVPNAFAHMIGGWTAFERMTEALNLGFIRREPPHAPGAILWAVWLGLAAAGAVHGFRAKRGATAVMPAPGLLACLLGAAIAALLILSYGTVTYRYRVEFWPLLYVIALVGMVALAMKDEASPAATRAKILGLLMLSAVSIGYSVYVQETYTTDGRVSVLFDPSVSCGGAAMPATPESHSNLRPGSRQQEAS